MLHVYYATEKVFVVLGFVTETYKMRNRRQTTLRKSKPLCSYVVFLSSVCTHAVHMITTMYDTIGDYGHNRVIEMIFRRQGRIACKQNVSRVRPLNTYGRAARTISEKISVYTLVLNPKLIFTTTQYIASSIPINAVGLTRLPSGHGRRLQKDIHSSPVTDSQIQSDN